MEFTEGDKLDVIDCEYSWMVATVISVEQSHIEVNYDGWPDKWNEELQHRSRRIAPLFTHTPPIYPLRGNELKLFEAAKQGDDSVVEKLLRSTNANVNCQHYNFISPLWEASFRGHTNVIKILVDAHADVDLGSLGGYTPFYKACGSGWVQAARLLLDGRADPNKSKFREITPLYIASQNGHLDVVELLISRNVNVNLHPQDHPSYAMNAAFRGGNLDLISSLLEANAKLNLPMTIRAFDEAMCIQKHSAIILHLLAFADPFLSDEHGVFENLIPVEEPQYDVDMNDLYQDVDHESKCNFPIGQKNKHRLVTVHFDVFLGRIAALFLRVLQTEYELVFDIRAKCFIGAQAFINSLCIGIDWSCKREDDTHGCLVMARDIVNITLHFLLPIFGEERRISFIQTLFDNRVHYCGSHENGMKTDL